MRLDESNAILGAETETNADQLVVRDVARAAVTIVDSPRSYADQSSPRLLERRREDLRLRDQ